MNEMGGGARPATGCAAPGGTAAQHEFSLALASAAWPISSMNSAVPATMLAFTYQSRYGLRQLLKAIFACTDAAIAIERLGDVEEHEAGAVKLHELKMHVAVGYLAERSVDLWKTLRIWCSHARAGKVVLPETTLMLATTWSLSTASDLLEALAGKTRPLETNQMVAGELTKIAESAGNQANLDGYREFLKLTPGQRVALATRIVIVPTSPSFAALDDEIARMAGCFFHGGMLPKNEWHQLIGWWDGKVNEMLSQPGSPPVTAAQLREFLQYCRDQCSLRMPLECFQNEKPEGSTAGDHSTYLRQLDLIKVDGTGKTYARLDFFRASLERNRWAESLDSYARLLDQFDRQLVEIWERARPDVTSTQAGNEEVALGAQLYGEIIKHPPVSLRSNWPPHQHYVTRGSFHLLANRPEAAPTIGWHPRFLELLAETGS